MIHEIGKIPFHHICKIILELNSDGTPREYMPQSRYKNSFSTPLNAYGHGPFCRFKIPGEYSGKTGVYVILVNGNINYVGECEDLGMRFNIGYGNISPKNCYKGGQPTNCRINNLILENYQKGSLIDLLFYETEDRFAIESFLIKEFEPPWNKTMGKSGGGRQQRIFKREGYYNSEKRRLSMSKYYGLEQHLRESQKQTEILSYEEIERILGFKLPPSAHNFREWWANGGHSQANSWLDAGWEVSSVALGKSITFRKMSETKPITEYRHASQRITSENKTEQKKEDIPRLIKELHQLKTEGIISEGEFEEKKKQLLSQL
jgi:hypothetical protein